MKAIQTLWCGDRKLTESPFWWLHPEYNLMSWALSCMSLREQFGEVTLYTDSEGAKMLVDKLKLPYTEVVVNYDGFDCLTCHWALAKVRTYSLQTEPFLHIDGDIYLPRPLPDDVLRGSLIVQNKEYCSDYYKEMINRFLSVEGLKLSPTFSRALRGDDVPSYNLGFCGGNDLGFFSRFCDEVYRFFRNNDFNGERFRNSDISANVVYEQMFFSIMAQNENADIAPVYPDTVRDNGYTTADFCDLGRYEQRQFIHILGGHKCTPEICRMVESTLLRKHPECYEKVTALFPERHKRLYALPICTAVRGETTPENYAAFLNTENAAWNSVAAGELSALEKDIAERHTFINASAGRRDGFIISRNPLIALYNIPCGEKDILKKRLNANDKEKVSDIAVIPSTDEQGYREYPLDNLAYNILSTLSLPSTYAQLKENIAACFGANAGKDDICRCVDIKTERLLDYGLVMAKPPENGS